MSTLSRRSSAAPTALDRIDPASPMTAIDDSDGAAMPQAIAPQFTIPARVIIPDGLEALDPAADVLWSHDWAGWSGQSLTRAGMLLAELQATIDMQTRGYFHIPAAAQILADAAAQTGLQVRRQMEAAIRSGALKIVGEGLLVERAPRPGRVPWSWSDFVRPIDVNRWLAESGSDYRFPTDGRKADTSSKHRLPPSQAKPRAAARSTPVNAPQRAASARWAHLDEFKAKALAAANSKPFDSRAEAAKHAADQLDPKPRPKSRPNGPDVYYDWQKVDEWLRDARWTSA
jgi:hypothetical protein